MAARTASGRSLAVAELGGDEMREHLGVGLAREDVAALAQHLLQLEVVLDDAVVHHRHAVIGVRVRVLVGGPAVRRPAGVADAQRAGGRLGADARLEVLQLPGRAHHVQRAAVHHRQPGRVVAAVLQLLQPRDQDGRRLLLTDVADDAAHGFVRSSGPSACARAPLDRGTWARESPPTSLPAAGPEHYLRPGAFARRRLGQPAFTIRGVREKTRVSGGTSSVTVVPAPT